MTGKLEKDLTNHKKYDDVKTFHSDVMTTNYDVILSRVRFTLTAWKGFKYGVFSGPYLDTFHAVAVLKSQFFFKKMVISVKKPELAIMSIMINFPPPVVL